MSLGVLILLATALYTVFGDKGLVDVLHLKAEKARVTAINQELTDENLKLYREIERLKKDPEYIEEVARGELGVVGQDELVIKLKKGR